MRQDRQGVIKPPLYERSHNIRQYMSYKVERCCCYMVMANGDQFRHRSASTQQWSAELSQGNRSRAALRRLQPTPPAVFPQPFRECADRQETDEAKRKERTRP